MTLFLALGWEPCSDVTHMSGGESRYTTADGRTEMVFTHRIACYGLCLPAETLALMEGGWIIVGRHQFKMDTPTFFHDDRMRIGVTAAPPVRSHDIDMTPAP